MVNGVKMMRLMERRFLFLLMVIFVVLSSILGDEDQLDSIEPESFSQWKQDEIVFKKFFSSKRDGTFVEIGAHDGLSFSNTLLFENLGWTGMLVEANAHEFSKLSANRKNAINIYGAAYDRNGVIQFRRNTGFATMLSGIVETYPDPHIHRLNSEIEEHGGETDIVEVPCYDTTDLLVRHGFTSIDYMSIDVEGSELAILRAIDFYLIKIGVLEVEDNYDQQDLFDEILVPKGFTKYARIGSDLVYTTLPITLDN